MGTNLALASYTRPTMTPLKPPRHLKAAGKALWNDIVQQYRIADDAGLAAGDDGGGGPGPHPGCAGRHPQARCLSCGPADPTCFLERDARAGMLSALRALNLDLEPLRDRGRSTVFDRK